MLYRLFPRDKRGGVLPGQELNADHDDDALTIARLMTSPGQGELWHGARLVGVLYPAIESCRDASVPAAQS